MKQFKLMTSLYGHTGDVKALCPTRDHGGFVSVSRDLTAKLWNFQEDSKQYLQAQTITSHKKYVNAVAVVYTLAEYPNGLIVTGSNDQTISIHDIEANTNLAQLKEHEGAVCALYFDNSSKGNLLYSGSFDSTAKVWDLTDLVKTNFNLKSSLTIKEHAHTVWSVLAVHARGILLTASADKTIKQFGVDAAKGTYEYQFKYAGHSDCVRSLCASPRRDDEFFSCSNDGAVVQWRLVTPMPLRRVQVTGSFLYSIGTLSFGVDDNDDGSSVHVITSGEDRSLRIHKIDAEKKADLMQSIVLPCQTLWSTVLLSNGAIAVACSDGSIRLFTQQDNLMASQSEIESFEKELAGFAISTKTDENLAAIKLNDLPGIDALQIPGRKDGQSIVVNNNNEAEVYQWEASEMRWVKIGVAVGSSQSGGGGARKKVLYEDKEYDYVFDIELDDTKASLKLPYNISEDPYHAAQKFIHKNELSQYFLDQIAHFIIDNTQSETIGDANAPRTYFDPFTGENRYVPPDSSSHSNGGWPKPSSSHSDPFTGSGAYKTSAAMEVEEIEKPAKQARGNEYYPYLEFILFDQVNTEPILKKAREFQQKSNLTGDLDKVENFISNLENIKSDSDFKNEIQSLFDIINSWSPEYRFPIVDLIRVAALNKKVSEHIIETNSMFKSLLDQVESSSGIVNAMLAVRALCNMFKSSNDAANSQVVLFLTAERQSVFKRVTELNASTDNKSFQIASATLLLNYVVMVKKMAAAARTHIDTPSINEIVIEFAQYVDELTHNFMNWDAEAMFRVLVAYGTLVSKTDSRIDYELVQSVAKSLQEIRLACDEINAKEQKYPAKVSSCAAYLLKEFK